MARVLVLTSDTVAPAQAGPAMRALAIADYCRRAGHHTTLATTGPVAEGSGALGVDADEAARLAAEHDLVILQGHVLRARLADLPSTVRLVIDAYDPIHIEQLAATTRLPADRRNALYDETIRSLDEQFRRADFVMCASDDQRALWLGHLAAVGRIDPATFDADPTLRRLIDVVPFGLPSAAPQRNGLGPRGRLQGVGPNDTVLLWNGGIYDWFDPATLLRAVAQLAPTRPRLRLVFMATTHPNSTVDLRQAAEAQRLSGELGLTGHHVFFNDAWVPADERQNWLLDADVVVSTHFDNVETDFAYRTRLLDALWAGRPVLSSVGGALPRQIAQKGAGLTAPVGDVAAVAAALEMLIDEHDRFSVAAAQLAATLTWDRVLAPLLAFIAASALPRPPVVLPFQRRGPVAQLARGFDLLDREGLGALWRRVRAR